MKSTIIANVFENGIGWEVRPDKADYPPFRLDDMPDAYDKFGNTAEEKAIKAMIRV